MLFRSDTEARYLNEVFWLVYDDIGNWQSMADHRAADCAAEITAFEEEYEEFPKSIHLLRCLSGQNRAKNWLLTLRPYFNLEGRCS